MVWGPVVWISGIPLSVGEWLYDDTVLKPLSGNFPGDIMVTWRFPAIVGSLFPPGIIRFFHKSEVVQVPFFSEASTGWILLVSKKHLGGENWPEKSYHGFPSMIHHLLRQMTTMWCFFSLHPDPWGNDPILIHIFQSGGSTTH